jgi:hypothetical protein
MSEQAGYWIQGGCLCGRVRFELTRPPFSAGYCHCTRCQRRTGTGSSCSAFIDHTALRWLQGEELIRGWLPAEDGAEKCFCGECGAHLFSRSRDGSRVGIRMGAFDSDAGVRPSSRQWVSSAATWEPIPDDGLPRFDGARPRDL